LLISNTELYTAEIESDRAVKMKNLPNGLVQWSKLWVRIRKVHGSIPYCITGYPDLGSLWYLLVSQRKYLINIQFKPLSLPNHHSSVMLPFNVKQPRYS
jgi:hypothetical protein